MQRQWDVNLWNWPENIREISSFNEIIKKFLVTLILFLDQPLKILIDLTHH